MPLRERTPDFLVYMLSACALRAKAAVAASRAVVRTMIVVFVVWRQFVIGRDLSKGKSSPSAYECVAHIIVGEGASWPLRVRLSPAAGTSAMRMWGDRDSNMTPTFSTQNLNP
jgi:hypothetical protein